MRRKTEIQQQVDRNQTHHNTTQYCTFEANKTTTTKQQQLFTYQLVLQHLQYHLSIWQQIYLNVLLPWLLSRLLFVSLSTLLSFRCGFPVMYFWISLSLSLSASEEQNNKDLWMWSAKNPNTQKQTTVDTGGRGGFSTSENIFSCEGLRLCCILRILPWLAACWVRGEKDV